MSSRTIYLRDRKNITIRKDGTPTRGNPICVIVSSIDRETNTVKYAIATVHKQDTFVKARGRTIAQGRLSTCPNLVMLPAELNGHRITEAIVSDIVSDENTPIKVMRAAKRWLKQASQPKEGN